LRHTTDEISELWKLIIIGLIIRYHRMVRVEAIMAYGSQGSYLLCVLELHLGPSEEAWPVLKKQDQSYVFPTWGHGGCSSRWTRVVAQSRMMIVLRSLSFSKVSRGFRVRPWSSNLHLRFRLPEASSSSREQVQTKVSCDAHGEKRKLRAFS
jgi:hypothetical protein